MELNGSFLKEEVRCDFLVTEKRKKIWNTEIQLLQKFDEFCRKHHLRYFAEYGTLLGAVRHQGFIPWDDDIDVVMFRDDYQKMQELAPSEFTEPLFFQNSYNDLMIWPFCKIRDSRTTAIEFRDADPELNQGIFIDIFALDDVPDGKGFNPNILTIQREIWQTITKPEIMLQALEKGVPFTLSADILVDLLKMPVRDRFRQFEEFNLSHFGTSERTNFIIAEMRGDPENQKKEWYSDTVYLPFEYTSIPAPIGYDELLKFHYGDYSQPVHNGSLHQDIFFDPDTPYLYYMNHRSEIKS